MNFVKVIRKAATLEFENEINAVLLANQRDKLIDIKYSSTYNDNVVIHTAIIIFEKA